MKYFVVFVLGISGLLVPSAFGVTEELIYGNSSIELLPSEIIPGKPTSFEIKFQYTEGPYALDNLIPIIEVNPASARSYVTIAVEPTGVNHGQIVRIPVTLTVDPQIESEKIFLSVFFAGDHFSSRSDAIYKSAWSESAILNISSKEFMSTELPSSQDYEFETMTGASCNGETSLCYGTFANGTTIQIQCDYRHSCVVPFNNYDMFYQSPLKQFKSGITIDEIQCNESLVLVTKNDGSPACVKPSSMWSLTERDWMKLVTFETTSGFPIHEIKNGQMISMKLVKDESCLPYIIIEIDSKDSGNLEIFLSRNILDPKINGQDDSFLVLEDGIEVAYSERGNSAEHRILDIPFEKGAKSIEIIATCLI